MIRFACGRCRHTLGVKADLAGRVVACAHCGALVRVPVPAYPNLQGGSASVLPAGAPRPEAADSPAPPAAEQATQAESPGTPGLGEGTVPAVDAGGQQGPYPFLAPPQAADELGRLGPYRVLQVLGAGGMGVVFVAEDPALRRLVALKAMLPGVAAGQAARRRFLREARTAAALEHDHVVPIYQVGEDRGTPYLAMQLLKGESLASRAQREGRLPPSEVLRIGCQTARGLAAAHEHGLIHRDIKPGNLWLEEGTGRVKILDFGLARAAADGPDVTVSGAVVGTPAYMAPEQARGDPVDARCDLFSLGCVLYRLATGQPAFRGRGVGPTLVAVLSENPTPVGQLCPDLPAPLADLIMRLLAKDPDRRPATARAVAETLEAIARPAGGGEPTVTMAVPSARAGGRRRRIAALAAGFLVTLGLGAWLIFAVTRARNATGELLIEADDPEVEGVVKDLGVTVRDQATGRQVRLKPGRHQLEAGEYELEVRDAGGAVQLFTRQFTLAQGETKTVRVAFGPRAWAKLRPAGNQDEKAGGGRRLHADDTFIVSSLAYSPDGHRALSANGPVIRLWDMDGGRELRRFQDHPDVVWTVAFSPDGRYALSGGQDFTGANDWAVRLWDLHTGRLLRRLPGHTATVSRAVFLGNGYQALTSAWDYTARLWDLRTGREVRTYRLPTPLLDVAPLGPDRALLACHDGTVRVWDLVHDRQVGRWAGHAARVERVALSPDGSRALTASHDHTCRLWDVASGRSEIVLRGHGNKVMSVAFSPDGRRGLSGSWDGTVRLWDLATGKELERLVGHAAMVNCVAWAPDGRHALSGGADGTLRLWRLPDPRGPAGK
jgi:hypothetical protein